MNPPSLFPLLNQIVDYAGLFPPANLPLEPAIRNFIRYQTWPEQWMLSRFVLPINRLDELSRLVDGGLIWDGTLAFSVLGSGTSPGFLDGMVADIQAVEGFCNRFGNRTRLDVYETRVPENWVDDPTQLKVGLAKGIPMLTGAGLFPFFEVPFGPGWGPRAVSLIHALGESGQRAGFKLRTGGVIADAIPTPAQVSLALCACRDVRVPLKCTAGLHHPLRSFREEVGSKMHGFLNVFIAGILANARGLDQVMVEHIVGEEDLVGFEFSTDEVGWRGIRVGLDQVATIRREEIISFGSCSFEEPKEDLQALGFDLIKS